MPPGYVRRGNALIRVDKPQAKGPHLTSSQANALQDENRKTLKEGSPLLHETLKSSSLSSHRQGSEPCSDSERSWGDGPDILVPPSKNFRTCLEVILPPLEESWPVWVDEAQVVSCNNEPDGASVRLEQPTANGVRGSDNSLQSMGSEPSLAIEHVSRNSEGTDGLSLKAAALDHSHLSWGGLEQESDSSSNISGDWPVYVTSSGEEDSIEEGTQAGGKRYAPPNGIYTSEKYFYSKRKAYQLVREPMSGSKKRLKSMQSNCADPFCHSEPPMGVQSKLVRMGSNIYRSGTTGHSRKLEIVSHKDTQTGADIKLKQGGQRLHAQPKLDVAPGLCTSFQKTGVCKWGPKCRYRHDPSKVAVCPSWLHGTCTREDCRLQHARRPELMPNCVHFLNGRCSRRDCPYSHANVHRNSPSCTAFILGYCPNGFHCPRKHFTTKMLADQDVNSVLH